MKNDEIVETTRLDEYAVEWAENTKPQPEEIDDV